MRVRSLGARLDNGLRDLAARYPSLFGSQRSVGLMAALDVREPFRATDVATAALQQGLLATTAGGNALRMLPPLVIDEIEIDEALCRLDLAAAVVVAASSREPR